MPISLQKGQKVDLTKGNPTLKHVLVGLGWDVNRYDGGFAFDLDASAFLLGANGQTPNTAAFIFYGNLKNPSSVSWTTTPARNSFATIWVRTSPSRPPSLSVRSIATAADGSLTPLVRASRAVLPHCVQITVLRPAKVQSIKRSVLLCQYVYRRVRKSA